MAMNVSCQARLETIVIQLITCFLDGNLQQQATTAITSDQNDEDADDEDENFDKNERTQKQEDLDMFAKLMRQKISESLDLLLQRFTQLMQQYELYLSQNQIPMVKACERQLAYLVRVVNSLFSFGMPAGMIKLAKNQRRAAS